MQRSAAVTAEFDAPLSWNLSARSKTDVKAGTSSLIDLGCRPTSSLRAAFTLSKNEPRSALLSFLWLMRRNAAGRSVIWSPNNTTAHFKFFDIVIIGETIPQGALIQEYCVADGCYIYDSRSSILSGLTAKGFVGPLTCSGFCDSVLSKSLRFTDPKTDDHQ